MEQFEAVHSLLERRWGHGEVQGGTGMHVVTGQGVLQGLQALEVVQLLQN